MANRLFGDLALTAYPFADPYANVTAEQLGMAADFTPVVGDVKAAYETADYLGKGEYGNAALSGIGLLPFVPSLVGSIKGSTKNILYRGQPKEFKNLQTVDQSDSIDNILIGKGIFTTTDEDIAKSYGENVFKFEIPSSDKVLDLSNASEEQLKKVMPEDFFRDKRLSLNEDDITPSGYKVYKQLLKEGNVKEAEDMLFDSYANQFLPEDITFSMVKNGEEEALDEGLYITDVRDLLSNHLQKEGFDFVKHKGGIRAGKGKEHDVYIALNDNALKNSVSKTANINDPLYKNPLMNDPFDTLP